jgi:hypothetical protein
MTIISLIRYTGLSSFSLNNIFENLTNGYTDSAMQYNNKFDLETTYGGGLFAPISTIIAPLLWPVLPLSLIYFRELSIKNKFFVLLTFLFEIARWISIGTNKGLVDLMLITIAVFLLKKWQRQNEIGSIKKIKTINNILMMILIIVCIFIVLNIFTKNISSRLNNDYSIVKAITNNTEINFNSPLMFFIPKSIYISVLYITVYLTQGYYGLSLTLDEQFVPMFGIGNSNFLIVNLEDFFNISLFQYTYQNRVALEGWSPYLNWHSIYSWFANDISYFGVVILMFFLGKYFSRIVYRSIVLKDPITSVLFCLLCIMFFYFPLNNQIFAMPQTFMTFWGLNIYWFITTQFSKYKLSKKVLL